jgi:ribosomal protein S11
MLKNITKKKNKSKKRILSKLKKKKKFQKKKKKSSYRFFFFFEALAKRKYKRKYRFWDVLFKQYVKYYYRQILLKTYRQKVFIRFQSNNLFLSTILPHREEYSGYRLSAGLISEYKKKKKKKKTYILGYELAYLFGEKLEEYKVKHIHFFFKGHSAQKRGVYHSLRKRKFRTLNFTDTTSVIHNGTKSVGKRRL